MPGRIFSSNSASSASYGFPLSDGAAANCFMISPGCTRERTSKESMRSK
jgi:hypothetical protein